MLSFKSIFNNELFKKSQKAYHAINLKDFRYYWQEGAVVSKGALEKKYRDFTPFFSDQKDKDIGVWNDCFGNLKDFGKYFWENEKSTPNAYGPITLVFKSSVWLHLDDVTIRTSTITNINSEILPKSKWGDIYQAPIDGKHYLKPEYTGAEFSTTSSISLDHLAFILVDPFRINGHSIKDYVTRIVNGYQSQNKLSERQIIERNITCNPQETLAFELLQWSKNLSGKLLKENEDLSHSLPQNLKAWFLSLEGWQKRILASWLTYTFLGTIQPIEDESI